MELLHSGKIRDVYEDRGDILLVASDKVSVYDVVLPTPIPGKGKILTQLSLWWFRQLADVVPNHVISAEDVPAEWAGDVALMVVEPVMWKIAAVVEPNLTAVAPVRWVPVMTTVVPPVAGPKVGASDVMVGGTTKV